MTILRRYLLSLRALTQRPLQPIWLIGLFLFFFLFLLWVRKSSWLAEPLGWMANRETAPTDQESAQQRPQVGGEEEYLSIASKINDLEIRKLIARGKRSDVGTAEIDKQLAPLRARLAQLQPLHDLEVASRRLKQEAEAQRQKEEQEQKLIEKMKREAAELEKRCEAVRSKRIADLPSVMSSF